MRFAPTSAIALAHLFVTMDPRRRDMERLGYGTEYHDDYDNDREQVQY